MMAAARAVAPAVSPEWLRRAPAVEGASLPALRPAGVAACVAGVAACARRYGFAECVRLGIKSDGTGAVRQRCHQIECTQFNCSCLLMP